MMTGTIARIPVDGATGRRRGFGFITGSDGTDYFFHATGLDRSSPPFLELNEGDRVEFEAEDGPKGLRAVGVRVV